MDSYRKVPADLLAAIAGYSFKTYIPPPPPVGFILNLFNGLTEPSTKDGIWFKTEDELGDGVIQMWLSQNNLTWTTGNAMPNGAYVFGGASVGTKVYMCGGYQTPTATRIYDTTTGTWTTGNAMPNGGFSIGGASVGTKVYMCGGSTNETATRIYDTTTGTWTTGNEMPNGDSSIGGASVGTKVYICGGLTYPTATRIYDTTTGTWTTGNAMPNGGFSIGGASVGTKVYMCGGYQTPTATRIYDTTTGTWTTGNAMPNGDYGFAGASVGTKVYMCGGDTNGTVTRILGTDDTVDYQDGTVMMAVGTLTHINTANVVKLAEGITLNISGVWIVQDGYMINYETYYGNGVSWVKKKDAD